MSRVYSPTCHLPDIKIGDLIKHFGLTALLCG